MTSAAKPTTSELLMFVSGYIHKLLRLEGRGWVRRSPSEADARVSLVSLTEKGRAELQKTNGCLRRKVEQELQFIAADLNDNLGRSLLPLAREWIQQLGSK